MIKHKKVFRLLTEWNYENEEEYLNAEVQKGFVLKKARFLRFEFEPCEPGEYTIRIMPYIYGKKSKKQHIEFMEETGAEYLGSYGDFLFFRKKTSLGDFDIYSDLDGKIQIYKGMQKTFALICFFNVAIGVLNVLENFGKLRNFCIGLCFFCAALMAFGFFKCRKKMLSLIKERMLHE